jgi:DNA-binding NarL/FixJ family response regulator
MTHNNDAVRVAVVEDHAALRATLVAVLEHLPGFRCQAAYPDGERAVEAIPGARPDVVLLDMSLPGMTAAECVRQLRGMGCRVPVIGFNQFHDPDQQQEILAAGATGYLLKEATMAELLEALRLAGRAGGGVPVP